MNVPHWPILVVALALFAGWMAGFAAIAWIVGETIDHLVR
jgi:hypothetical protein